MNSEHINHQTDWLAQTEELNDTEASQVNGGASAIQSAQQSAQQSAADQARLAQQSNQIQEEMAVSKNVAELAQSIKKA
jgi:hypothetical protein